MMFSGSYASGYLCVSSGKVVISNNDSPYNVCVRIKRDNDNVKKVLPVAQNYTYDSKFGIYRILSCTLSHSTCNC